MILELIIGIVFFVLPFSYWFYKNHIKNKKAWE